MSALAQWIAAARETVAKATPGPIQKAVDDEWTIVAGGLTVAENLRSEADSDVHVLAVNALPALLDVAEAAEALADNLGCSCYLYGGPCPRCKIAFDDTRTALARLREVEHDAR